MICFNYTGDRLHFGIAVEKAKARGQNIDLVYVADDVSVGKELGGRVGRRGLAGIALVHKIAGGCASTGRDLKAVKEQAIQIAQNLVTVGASLAHASVPGSNDHANPLHEDEIEIGMGIHNEPGFEKIKIPPVSELVTILLKQLLDQKDGDRAFVPFTSGDDVVLMINNLDAISNLELYHLTQIVGQQVEQDYSLNIVRTYTGNFVTSLDGAGASITLLNISNLQNHAEVLQWLDLPTDAPGWNSRVDTDAWSRAPQEVSTDTKTRAKSDSKWTVDSRLVKSVINAGCGALVSAEDEITRYDTVAGDGDAGTTLRSAAESILKALEDDHIDTTNAVDLLNDIAGVLEDTMGGTGGALYTIFFSALATALTGTDKSEASGTSHVTTAVMANAVGIALQRLCTYTTAQVGDKTLMDALIPFSETLSKSNDLAQAVEAARVGAEGTKGMQAGLGRATYVDSAKSTTVPDAGAIGVFRLLSGILSAF